jgi:hypothetical protein
MSFAIIRVGKLKTMGNVAGQGSHVERIRETPNADHDLKLLNNRLIGTADPAADVQVRFRQAGIEPRKGAVLAIDVFISASPEHFANNHPDDPNWKAFQERAMDFLRQEYGDDNVVHAIAHHDETSPHLHAIVTPIKSKTVKVGRTIKTERIENRLCARDWLGGDRTTLSKLQTRFANSVKDLGLHRGIEGSRAKHTEVKQFYAVMKETVSQAQAINQEYASIHPDHFVNQVAKPGLFDMAKPRQFAQAQVSQAVNGILSRIQQYNHNTEITRRRQVTSLQAPAQVALRTKAGTREIQAEAALQKLGYRLDQHGQLVNILEERQNKLRTTISQAVRDCTSPTELRALLDDKSVKMSITDQILQEHEGKSYRSTMYHDGKGTIAGADLGWEFTTVGLMQRFEQNKADKESELQSKSKSKRIDNS